MKPTETLKTLSLSPSDYGFEDAYPTDFETQNTFKTHKIERGSCFRTRRYRTGYIHNEYIVMSPIKTDITEAFIEYEFDIPVKKINVELSHWREYNKEWLDKDRGRAELQILNKDTWVTAFDLLSDETSLPRDRTTPTKYTITFKNSVFNFRFYSCINVSMNSSSNRGRICIGNMEIYFLV